MAIQLISNGGFETGRLTPGWRQVPGSATFDGAVTDTTPHRGTYSLRLGAMDFIEQSFVGLAARATGALSFYAKAASALEAGPFFVRIEYADGTKETPFYGSLTDRWQLMRYPVDPAKTLKKIVFGTGESGDVYVDDVSMVGSKRAFRLARTARAVEPV
jgi:hypothetical protein